MEFNAHATSQVKPLGPGNDKPRLQKPSDDPHTLKKVEVLSTRSESLNESTQQTNTEQTIHSEAQEKEEHTKQSQRSGARWHLLRLCEPLKSGAKRIQNTSLVMNDSKNEQQSPTPTKRSIYDRIIRNWRWLSYDIRHATSWRRPWPQDPRRRYMGYEWIEHLEVGLPVQIASRVNPSLGQVRTNVEYWREDYGTMSEATTRFWTNRLGILPDALLQHFRSIRLEAWQVVQEFSIARFWFIRSILAANPYYPEVLELAKNGATVVDLACGFGQELRWLHEAGASGNMFAIDLKGKMWNLGHHLFQENPKWATFRRIDIIHQKPRHNNPLQEFTGVADVYLLNDFLSFLGPNIIEATLVSISKASRVGTKVIGWAIGQEGDEEIGMRVHGTGGRGSIHNLVTFQKIWTWVEGATRTNWKVEAQLVDFAQLGFDEEDCEWFASSWFDDPLAGSPMPLRGLCFLSTRVD